MMPNKKRALASLGLAVFIVINASFLILLIWKLLNSPRWLTTAIMWIVAWPLLALMRIGAIPYPGIGVLLFAMFLAITIDVLLFTGLTYGVLSLFSKKSLKASTPPPSVPII